MKTIIKRILEVNLLKNVVSNIIYIRILSNNWIFSFNKTYLKKKYIIKYWKWNFFPPRNLFKCKIEFEINSRNCITLFPGYPIRPQHLLELKCQSIVHHQQWLYSACTSTENLVMWWLQHLYIIVETIFHLCLFQVHETLILKQVLATI